MTRLSTFEKRLKRQVVARPAEFFAATTPGLETLCQRELKALSLNPSSETPGTGGVTFTGPIQDCYKANLCLRTANRILMRIHVFKASNFPTLKRHLVDFPWELYLQVGSQPLFQITAHRSRLHHSGAIADRFQNSISRRWAKMGIETDSESDENQSQILFVRVKNDAFTVSLDSSGENLYRRGLKKDITAAPLRETIASALLILAQYKPPEPLIDPMSGAGSFSLEAAMQIHNIPPGWFRDFAFYRWPVFKITDKRWNHIRKHMQKEIIEKAPATIYATDVDPAACETLARNSKAAGLSQTIQIANRDFFEFIPDKRNRTPGLIVINAPFGRRIGSFEQSDRLFLNLFNRLKTMWQGWKVGLVIPRRNLLKKVPFYNVPLSIRHGGLQLYLVTGRISG